MNKKNVVIAVFSALNIAYGFLNCQDLPIQAALTGLAGSTGLAFVWFRLRGGPRDTLSDWNFDAAKEREGGKA